MLSDPIEHKLMNKLTAGQPEKRAHELIERAHDGTYGAAYAYDDRASSHVTAELIRRDLLSRKDLMQLYRPPLKKNELAQNNPFTSKSIVGAQRINFGPMRNQSGNKTFAGNSLVPISDTKSFQSYANKLPLNQMLPTVSAGNL